MHDKISNNSWVKLSDTDSIYIEMRPMLNKLKELGVEINDISKNKILLKIAHSMQGKINGNLDRIIPLHHNIKSHYFEFKSEIIAQTILATGKRRYGMWITSKEGVDIPPDHKDALDLKGLEVMKSNINPIFKKFGEQFIKDVLFGTPKPGLDKSILQLYKSLKEVEPKKLGKPIGVSFIDKCIKRSPNVGEIFSDLNINTKENSRAAIYYNDLLKFKKLNKKYEGIIEGDKILVVNLKQNPYNIDVIAIPNSPIPTDIEQFVKDYIDIDSIFESSILNKLKELYKDLGWEFPIMSEKINKYFKFL